MHTCSVSRPVRLELELGENAGEIDARSEFRRQDVDFEAERTEPGFDAEMPRRQPAVAGALIAPIGLLRRGDEGRMAGVFQFFGQPIGDLVHFSQTSMSMYCTGTLVLQRNAPAGIRCTSTITLLQ